MSNLSVNAGNNQIDAEFVEYYESNFDDNVAQTGCLQVNEDDDNFIELTLPLDNSHSCQRLARAFVNYATIARTNKLPASSIRHLSGNSIEAAAKELRYGLTGTSPGTWQESFKIPLHLGPKTNKKIAALDPDNIFVKKDSDKIYFEIDFNKLVTDQIYQNKLKGLGPAITVYYHDNHHPHALAKTAKLEAKIARVLQDEPVFKKHNELDLYNFYSLINKEPGQFAIHVVLDKELGDKYLELAKKYDIDFKEITNKGSKREYQLQADIKANPLSLASFAHHARHLENNTSKAKKTPFDVEQFNATLKFFESFMPANPEDD